MFKLKESYCKTWPSFINKYVERHIIAGQALLLVNDTFDNVRFFILYIYNHCLTRKSCLRAPHRLSLRHVGEEKVSHFGG